MVTGRLGTMGEELVGRPLEKELRAGVMHYVPGQHHAEIVVRDGRALITNEPEQIARLTYVDVMGHAVAVSCSRRDETATWRPSWVARAGQVTAEPTVRADTVGFELSAAMLDALEAAT